MEEMLHCLKWPVGHDPRLLCDSTELYLIPGEQLSNIEISVTNLQETEVSKVERPHCSGMKAFHNSSHRKHEVWILSGGHKSYGDMGGQQIVPLV